MALLRRLTPLAVLLAAGALGVAPAAASSTQQAIFQDDVLLKPPSDPSQALATFQSLGVGTVKVTLNWDSVAPARRPAHFNPADPSDPAYQAGFAMYDAIVRDAFRYGIRVFFSISGPAPSWADAPGEPKNGFPGVWKPSASQFGAFVTAVARRYNGQYNGLPAVTMWSLWNEPNYGYDIAPQAVHGVEVGAVTYRGLLNAGWNALTRNGHSTRSNTILMGETAPHGVDASNNNFSGVKPLRFLRALYCVDSRYRPLRGNAARQRGCPTTAAGSRGFRRANPALFSASGFAAHLYSLQAHPAPPPVAQNGQNRPGIDPDYADLATVGQLTRALDRLNGTYGSRTRFAIYDTEYAYRTRPPDLRAGVSLSTAALYINWAEYLHYRNSRIKSYDQYLLVDPAARVFASGLEFPDGTAKPSLDAYRMPLFLPVTTARRGHSLEVWGAARPAYIGGQIARTAQYAVLQYRRGNRGAWVTQTRVRMTSIEGYFDIRVKFPASGAVRLTWTAPGGTTYAGRTVLVTIR